MRNVQTFLTNQKGVSMLMVVGFLALAVPVVTAALALAGTLSLDSLVKGRLARDQYSHLGIQNHIQHVVDAPGGGQPWVDTGCVGTINLNGQDVTLSCEPPAGTPGEPPSLSNRQLRTFKEVSPSTAGINDLTTYTFTIMAVNGSGADVETQHRHLGHGYWKQPHHFPMWESPYDPTDDFNATFGLTNPNDLNPDKTLLQALQEGGGHQDAFNREAVTALLNAASASSSVITFASSEAGVQGIVLDAYTTGIFEPHGRLLRAQNFQACFIAGENSCVSTNQDAGDTGGERLQRIYDGLPPGFSYVSGSTFINGVASGDPALKVKVDSGGPSGASNLGPGYWKTDIHFPSWVGYNPTSPHSFFDVVFGVGPNDTFIDVVSQSGGPPATRMRAEAVAGLLNASNPAVVYAYTAQQVKDLVVLAYANGSYGATRDVLNAANQAAYFLANPRSLLEWDLEALDFQIPSGELLILEFDARARVNQGNYCNQAWVEPGFKDHDAKNGPGRGTGTDMTARVKVGNPPTQLCPGEAVFVTTRVDQPVALAGVSNQFTYTIEIENVGTTTLHIAKINDILPPGFVYVAGSTTGITNWEPSPIVEVNGSYQLRWSDPFVSSPPTLAPGSKLTLSFKASATLPDALNYANEVWVYFTELTDADDGVFSWPTAVIRAMDVFVVTATDAEGNVVGTYQVWVGADETLVR